MREPASWKGSGNVYSVGGFWMYGSPVLTLDAWRAKFGGDADSLDAGPLPPDPAQWRLLPQSPGYHAMPDGTDMGADVSRVNVVHAAP